MLDLTAQIDYQAFLSRLDLKWDDLVHRGGRYYDNSPSTTRCDWGEAAFLGNGMIGAAIYKKTAAGLTWELGRNDVEAGNHLKGVDWCVPRVPIGDLLLSPVGQIQQEGMRLSLHDAEASGETRTNTGSIRWASFADAVRDILVITLETDKGEAGAGLRLIPAHGVSPRLHRVAEELAAAATPLPPPPVVSDMAGVELVVQEFVNDDGEISGECATALKRIAVSPARNVYVVSIEHSRDNGIARQQAVAAVDRAATDGLTALVQEHRDWWHSYYPRSFVSIPDTRWESFYWIQMYKLASATRGNMDEAIDNQGPWLTDSAWPGTWWNLNVQLSYSSLYKANRLDLARSLINTVSCHEQTMRQNAKPITEDGIYMGRASGRFCGGNTMPSYESIMAGNLHVFELGNFAWIVKLMYTHYRSTMDRDMLLNTVYPVLRATMNVGLKLLRRWPDGKLHLPKTTSPEYPDVKNNKSNSCPAYDTSYDLALIRWGLGTLLRISDEQGLNDELCDTWRETLQNLSPLCVNENGIMVARDLPFEVSHRHYSHLFAIYPLHLLDLEDKEEFELTKKSFLHWINTTGALQGYSYTGGTCMAASIGDGNLALECLNGLRDYLLPNSMYVEGGGPVIETPLSGAESIHYLLLQCQNDIIRTFPAIPDRFADVEFARLLAEGAFEVSGKRTGGRNQWVYVTSLAGEPLRIMPNLAGKLSARGGRKFELVEEAHGIYTVDLKQGESVLLYAGDTVPTMAIAPVPSEKGFENFYGSLKPAMHGRAKVRHVHA